MSRNFELLDQTGRTQIFDTEEEVQRSTPAEIAAEIAPFEPYLHVDGTVRDELTKLVQNLFHLPDPVGPRRVVFAGTESGTGCSWMCAHAAQVLASHVSGPVCVVDCNLRAPCLHQQFGLQNHNGLSDALLNLDPICEYANRLSASNLWVLTGGKAAEDSASLLASDRMRVRLRDLGAAFDYVLLDTAPLNLRNDAIVLGGLSDGVVLVLKANVSRRETARKVLQELQAAGIATLGAVLNERTFPIPHAIYSRL